MTIKELRVELERVPKEMDGLNLRVAVQDHSGQLLVKADPNCIFLEPLEYVENPFEEERYEVVMPVGLPAGWQVHLMKPTLAGRAGTTTNEGTDAHSQA